MEARLLAFVILQGLSPSMLPSDSWVSISRRPALTRSSEIVDFLFNKTSSSGLEFDLRLTSRAADDTLTVKWTSTERCKEARTAALRLRDLPFPAVRLPSDPEEVVLDGTSYSVKFLAGYGSQNNGELELRSNVGTPLAAWINTTLSNLDNCWSHMRPMPK